MINEDTVKLLKKYNADVKTRVSSLDEAVEHVKIKDLKLLGFNRSGILRKLTLKFDNTFLWRLPQRASLWAR